MKSIKQIQKQLDKIDHSKKNNSKNLFINNIKNEFIKINGVIKIPKLPVKELEYEKSSEILKDIIKYIPEFLTNHSLLKNRKPPSEQHSLHFVKKQNGRIIDFIHIFKIDFKFAGDSSNIIEKGDSNNYPSYFTDRFYYKSRLIPAQSIEIKNLISNFKPIKLNMSNYVESDKAFFTSAIFDEINRNKITKDIINKLGLEVFNISQELYPFIIYDFFTACFNILNPISAEIDKAVELFEPIFLQIFSEYNNFNELNIRDSIQEKFKKSIIFKNQSILLSESHIEKLQNYFKHFTIYRDDELSLKGWWRIDIAN